MSEKKSSAPVQTCVRHRDEPILVFSLKLEKSMCLKCAMLEHDQISDFVPISEGARMMKVQGNKILEEIKSTDNAIKHIRNDKNKYLEKLRESERLVKEGVKVVRDKMNKLLNTLENKALGQLKQVVKNKEACFAKFKQDIYNIEEGLKNIHDNVHSSLKTGNELTIIATVVREKAVFNVTKEKVQEKRSQSQTENIHFRSSAIIKSFLENAKSLGEVSCVDVNAINTQNIHEKQTFVANLSNSNLQPSPDFQESVSMSESQVGTVSNRSQRLARFSRFHHGYEIHNTPVVPGQTRHNLQAENMILTTDHDGPCNHTGIATLNDGFVVVCDARHKCVQLISRDSRLLDDIIFQCKPSDITPVFETGIAVGFQDKEYISLFNISDKRFVHVKDISVSGRGGSYSIANSRNRLALCKRGEIRIISVENGALLNVIQIEAHFPRIALGESDSRIYLSVFVGGKIVCLTDNGVHRWEYSRESLEPTCIAIDLNQLYVTDIKGKILVLSTYGLLVREIECPGQLNALCIDGNTGTVLVTQENKDKRKSRIIKIVSV